MKIQWTIFNKDGYVYFNYCSCVRYVFYYNYNNDTYRIKDAYTNYKIKINNINYRKLQKTVRKIKSLNDEMKNNGFYI